VAAATIRGLAPAGALNRGTGHVTTKTTKPGVNGSLIWVAMFGGGPLQSAMVDISPAAHLGGTAQSGNKSLMWSQNHRILRWSILGFAVLRISRPDLGLLGPNRA